MGLPSEVKSGLLVQWMKRGSVSSNVGPGGVEVLSCPFSDLFKLLLNLCLQAVFFMIVKTLLYCFSAKMMD